MKVYICGPISNIEGGNKSAFADMDNKLKALEIKPVNPHTICRHLNHDNWAECMKADIKQLVDCDAVIMLTGWKESKVATMERELALRLGIPVFYSIDELNMYMYNLSPHDHIKHSRQ